MTAIHPTDIAVSRMNAARDRHRTKGTTGGKGNARPMTATEYRARDAGLPCHELALAAVESIWSDFRSWCANERPGQRCEYVPETDFPF